MGAHLRHNHLFLLHTFVFAALLLFPYNAFAQCVPVIANSGNAWVQDNLHLSIPRAVEIDGNYAYVVNQSNKFTVIDISDPLNPVIANSGNAWIQDNSKLQSAYALEIVGNYAYVTGLDADALTVVDISDPLNPVIANSGNALIVDATRLDGAIDVAISGNYAYVTAVHADAVVVVDISDPLNPVIANSGNAWVQDVSRLNSVRSIEISGNYAYVAASATDTFTVIDISDPLNPVIANSGNAWVQDSGKMDNPRDIQISGNYAYVASFGTDSITVIDISDPLNPVIANSGNAWVQHTTKLNGPNALHLVGDIAYVASQVGDSITAVNLSDPLNPVLENSGNAHLASATRLDGAFHLQVAGNYAYVLAGSDNSLTVVDLSSCPLPAAPEPGTYTGPMTCDANYEAVMIFNHEKKVMQYCDSTDWIDMGPSQHACTDGGPPLYEVGNKLVPDGEVLGVWAQGGNIFTANGWNGSGDTPFYAHSFDGQNFATVDSATNSHGYPEAVWGDGTYLYMGAPGSGLFIYELVGSTLTLRASNTTTVDEARQVWGDGTYIYVPSGSDGIYAFTFDGTTLTQAGPQLNKTFALGAYAENGYIFAGYGSTVGMFTFDGTTWTTIDEDSSNGGGQRFWGDGTYLYAANGAGISAYSYDGTGLTHITTYTTPGGNARGIWGDGEYIYLADSQNGLYVFEFDGSSFTEVQQIIAPDGNLGLAVHGDGTNIYFGNQNYGMRTYQKYSCSGACLNPTGTAGEINYNEGNGAMQYCNGYSWVNMGPVLAEGGLDAVAEDLSPANVTNGLLGHWTLDTDATDVLSNNDGTATGGPSHTTLGRIEGAISLNGTSQYVDLGTGADLKPTFPATLSAWVYIDDLSTDRPILTTSNDGANYQGIWFMIKSTGIVEISYGDGSGLGGSDRRTKVGTTSLQTGKWYHVAGVVRGPTDMDIYVNGVDDGGSYSGTAAAYLPGTNNALIGRRSFVSDIYFDGRIDDVRMYSRDLSAQEVENLYKHKSLVGHWKMDEATGTDISDSSSYGNDGAMYGGLDGSADSVEGKHVNALDFDGSDDRVSIFSSPTMNDSYEVTYAGWFYPTSLSTNRRLFENGVTVVSTSTSNNISVNFGRWSGGYPTWTTDPNTFTLNQWHHLAVTYDYSDTANDPVVYINGQSTNLTETTAPSGTVTNTGNYALHIGNRSGGDRPWQGHIDDVRQYNRVLSQAEIQDLQASTGGIYLADCTGLGDAQFTDTESGHCYWRVTPAVNWADAQANCAGDGGYLITITTAAEQTIFENLKGGGYYWIGAKDDAVDGEWRWQGGEVSGTQFWQGDDTGSAVSGLYNNWITGEPNGGGGENCLMSWTGDFWNDQSCAATYHGGHICEKSPGTTLNCSNPRGVPGEIIYNDDNDIMQYCNGSSWIKMH